MAYLEAFKFILNNRERKAQVGFRNIVGSFLGNHRILNYNLFVKELLTSYKILGSDISQEFFSRQTILEMLVEHNEKFQMKSFDTG